MQSEQFKQAYVSAFAIDCTEAYNVGNRMSCGKGVKERIVTSLETAIASVDMTPEYWKLLQFINPRKYSENAPVNYNQLFGQFGSVCMNENRGTFEECMKEKMREELGTRYNEEAVSAALREYVRSLGIFNNIGGFKKYKTRRTKRRAQRRTRRH